MTVPKLVTSGDCSFFFYYENVTAQCALCNRQPKQMWSVPQGLRYSGAHEDIITAPQPQQQKFNFWENFWMLQNVFGCSPGGITAHWGGFRRVTDFQILKQYLSNRLRLVKHTRVPLVETLSEGWGGTSTAFQQSSGGTCILRVGVSLPKAGGTPQPRPFQELHKSNVEMGSTHTSSRWLDLWWPTWYRNGKEKKTAVTLCTCWNHQRWAVG